MPMQVYGTDWRLLPRLWFMFTTPDLSEPALPYWGEELPQLQQHLKGNAFWSAWKNLASSADSLEKVYLDAMSRVLQVPVEQVPNGLPRELRFIAARVPDNLSDMMPPEPPYSIEDYNRVMSWIQADNPATYDDILARQQDLETRLCRLNDCIRDKLVIDRTIHEGKCDACLSFRP